MTITKAQLATSLHEELGFNKRESKEFIEHFFESLRESLEQGNPVKLSSFGNFAIRDKPSRPGRNPKSGEEVPIQARRVVTFKTSKKAKELIEENTENLKKMLS